MESLTTSARNMPKMSTNTLEIRKNYYVIPDGEKYHYFAIKIEENSVSQPIMRFDKAPPVLIEGIAIIGRKLYRVPIKDLMRGIIRKSREINQANRVSANGSSRTASSTDNESSAESGTKSSPSGDSADHLLQCQDQSGTSESSTVEISEAADLAWTEQIESLLSFISEKEGVEWEVADPAQSGSADESSAVQNLERDSREN